MIGTISANNRLIPATVARARCGKGSRTLIKCDTVTRSIHLTWDADEIEGRADQAAYS
jgi:uncharacterized Zn ribbon protein